MLKEWFLRGIHLCKFHSKPCLDLEKRRLKEVRGRYLGRTVNVLVESASPKGDTFMGRSEHNLIVHITGSTASDKGKIVPVKVVEILENTMRGEKIG